MRGYSRHWKQYVQRPNGIAGEVFFVREWWSGSVMRDNAGEAMRRTM